MWTRRRSFPQLVVWSTHDSAFCVRVRFLKPSIQYKIASVFYRFKKSLYTSTGHNRLLYPHHGWGFYSPFGIGVYDVIMHSGLVLDI